MARGYGNATCEPNWGGGIAAQEKQRTRPDGKGLTTEQEPPDARIRSKQLTNSKNKQQTAIELTDSFAVPRGQEDAVTQLRARFSPPSKVQQRFRLGGNQKATTAEVRAAKPDGDGWVPRKAL